MENKIIFHANIDDDPTDFTRLQDFAEASLDHVVLDGISDLTKYTGFGVTKSAVTQISVAPGRLYSAGKVYSSAATAWAKDFITQLPVAGKKIAAVVTWGSESDTDVRPRQFLINAETRQAEPQAVPLVHARVANLNVVIGNEAPDPVAPLVDVGYTIIALVTLTPTGVDTITMVDDNKLPSVQAHEQRIDDLETFEETAGLQIKTLSSDIAALKQAANRGEVDQATMGRTLTRLAVLESKNGVVYTAIDSSANFFLDTSKSLLTDPLSHVKVEEGIRMPHAAEGLASLQIFNPLDAAATVKNGMLFPAYTREAWLQSGSISGELQVAAYTVSSFDMVQKTIARQRIRYGAEFIVCTNSLFWQTGQFDGVSRFYRAGEVYEVENPGDAWGHSWMRLRQIWIDNYQEAYWDKVTITNTVTGTQVAETWLQGQNMWLDAVGIWFTRLAASGSAHVAIVEVTDYGLPNLKKVIQQTTLLRENMKLNAETVVPLQPTFLQAGKRYALVITTAADHWVAVVPGQQFTQGTFFYVLDGAYAQGDAFKDLWMRLYRCKFNQARSVITLNPLQLSGGILAIDMIAGTIVPDGTTLSYEIQVGSTWYNLLDVDKYMLGQGGTIPPLLPLRAVFMGSVDCMPAINLADSSVYVSRPDVYAQHVTQTRTLPAASTQIRVIERYEGYDPIYHTKSVKLLTGAGFGTQTAPSSTSTYVDPNDGATEVTYVFNLGAAITQFRILTRLDTSTNQRVFHVAWQKDYAL
ncbi:hypothetical protein I6F34_00935 [Bradyrhizobium sp. BRP05]|nr:hypothetical protein [Bradyrhizobium sp. BRP05]